ncbi:cytochrome P450 2K1-like isoform X2 [Sander vitreus]
MRLCARTHISKNALPMATPNPPGVVPFLISFAFNNFVNSGSNLTATCKVCGTKINEAGSTTSDFIRHLKTHLNSPPLQSPCWWPLWACWSSAFLTPASAPKTSRGSLQDLLLFPCLVTCFRWISITSTYPLLICPKNMDQCSQSTWDRRRWWSWQDTGQSNRLWSTMLRSLETERSLPYSMISTKEMMYNMFPWLGPFLKNWRDAMKNVEANREDIKSLIADLKETLNPEMCRCFVDAFLSRKLNVEESEIKDSHYHDDNLVDSVMNLFAAGTDTTGNTLQWCLLFMAKYPHFQDQVQAELSRVVGSRQVRLEDRMNLPYTDAVIHETQRLANIVPMSIPHKTSRDVTFQGYFIKEGTTVFPLLTSVLHDESEWESPHTFNPSHFLDKEGKFTRRDAFMPFSAGRRVCLGESLARMELFLFFTALLQHFRFTPPPGVTEDELDLTPAVGFILAPSPHELCAVSRQ